MEKLDVMIGIHKHGRQQLAVVTVLQNDYKCMEVDHRRWVVQEAVHQGIDLITHVMAVMCLNIFVFSLSFSLLSSILVGRFLNILVCIAVASIVVIIIAIVIDRE